ncbi:MAG: PhnD/SsuA/transferrin family substrate-binding protein [Gemmatimonadota bacterium]
MRRPVSRAAAVCLGLLAVLSAACDRPKGKSGTVPEAGAGKTVVTVACSDEAHGAFLRIAGDYSARSGVRFEVSQAHSAQVVDLVGTGAVHMGVVSRRLARDERSLGLSYVPLADDGVVFVASRDAKVRALTSAQIRRILSGEIANWRQVGGADGPIRVICRPAHSSVSAAVANALFGGTFPPTKAAFVLETNESAYQALKTLPYCLAIVPMSRTIVDHFPVDAVAVDGMPPLGANVSRARYPARLELGILFREDAPDAVTGFARYAVSSEGMHKMASAGLVPSSGNMSLSSCHCRATDGAFAPSRRAELAGLLTIGVVPELGPAEQRKRYAGICRVIAEEMGIKTYLKHMETYGQVVREFAEGRIDAAFVGSLVYGRLHARFGVTPLVRPESAGVSRYRGLVVVRAASGIRGVRELRGRSLACVPGTSAGDLYVRALAAAAGSSPDGYFSRLENVSSHAEAVRLLDAGKVDAAAVKDLVLNRMFAATPGLKGRVRILETSPDFPENALVVQPGIDAKRRGDLVRVLLACDRAPAGKAALAALGADRFVITAHEDYANMYALAESVGYDLRK